MQATGFTDVCTLDVEVKGSLEGFSAVNTIKLAVNTFKWLERYTPKPPASTSVARNNGWYTTVSYYVKDLCGNYIWTPINVNESFGTRTPSTSQWVLPTRQPGLVVPFGDEIAVAPPQPGTVQPTVPQSPLGNTEVDRIPFYARLGSQTSGSGFLVTSTDQIRYIDHGDHGTAFGQSQMW